MNIINNGNVKCMYQYTTVHRIDSFKHCVHFIPPKIIY